MQTISTLTICSDEAFWILHMLNWLSPMQLIDEAVIVDGGSKDETIDVIKAFKREQDKFNFYKMDIKLIENPMPDSFADQRNLALSHCSGDWILQIDADETYSANIRELLQKVKQGWYENYLGIIFPTAHLIQDEFHMNDNGGDVHIRLFKNLPAIKFRGDVHEELYCGDIPLREANIINSGDVALRHYSMLKSKEDLLVKGKRYLQWTKKSQEAGIPLTDDEEFFIKAIENRIMQGNLIDVPKEWY